MRKKGRSYQYIADHFKVSRQNIWALINYNGSSTAKLQNKKNKDKKLFNGNRQKVIERDAYKCQICWMTEKEHKELFKCSLNVHHLDGNKKNNLLKNLMTLCIQCHSSIHRNKKKQLST